MLNGVVLRALALLAICGASCGLFAQELRGDWLVEFVRANTLSLPNRRRLLAGMVVGAAVALLVGALLAWRRGPASVRRLARRAAPLATLGLWPPLLHPAAWDPLHAVLAMGGLVLLFERTLRVAFAVTPFPSAALVAPTRLDTLVERVRTRWAAITARVPAAVWRWSPVTIVCAAALGYAIYFSIFTLWMHGRFQTYGYDLGQYDNIFYSTLKGRPLRCAPLNLFDNWSELRNHAELSVFFLLPFYALAPSGATLLVIQSTVLGLGAIPLYRFAARRLPRSYACALAVAYLFFPPMHGLQFYDFHFQPIAATFVLLVIDFLDEKRWIPMALCFAVAIGCREDVSIGLTVLGLFVALIGYRVRAGLIMAVVGATYFVLMRFVIMPSFGPWWFAEMIYGGLLPEGAKGFGGVIATIATNPAYLFKTLLTPEKLRYALQILVPVAFLPLRRPWLAVAALPGSLFTLLTVNYPATTDIGFQYSAHYIPYIFSASAIALALAGEAGIARRRAALGALVAGTFLTTFFWGAVPPRAQIKGGFFMLPMTPPTAEDRQKHRDLQELNGMIPAEAFVAVSEQEMPHISRLNTLSLRDTLDKADYLLYGTMSGYYGGDRAAGAIANGDFKIIAEKPGLAVAKRVRRQ